MITSDFGEMIDRLINMKCSRNGTNSKRDQKAVDGFQVESRHKGAG